MVIPTNKSGAAAAATADAANGSVPSPPIDRAGTAGGGFVAFGFGGGGAAGAVATLASSTRRSIDPSVRATVPICARFNPGANISGHASGRHRDAINPTPPTLPMASATPSTHITVAAPLSLAAIRRRASSVASNSGTVKHGAILPNATSAFTLTAAAVVSTAVLWSSGTTEIRNVSGVTLCAAAMTCRRASSWTSTSGATTPRSTAGRT